MKMKNVVKITLIILVVLVLIFMVSANVIFAATVNSLEAQKDELENEISDTKDKISDVKKELSSTMNEIEDLINQIADYETEIENLDLQIEEITDSIEEAEKQIEESEKELAEKQDLLNRRLIAMYKAGDSSYLDVLLGSENVVDFISNYYLVEELADYDTKLIESVEAAKNEIEASKVSLEESKKEVEELKKKQVAKKNSLDVLKKDKEAKAANLSEDEKQLKKQLEELAAENRSLDQKIKAAQEAIQNDREDYISSGGSSSSGFIRPVNGYSVTTGLYYSSGAYHGAVDYSGPGISGKPVYAVADGYVVTAKALNYSYGNYVLIAHYNGLYTLYAHGQMGSITVKEGQRVKQGQQIMRVGSTGNSTGPHLHFEVRTGGGSYSERVNPLNYLP